MLMKSVAVAATGLAATCNAFLLPAEVSEAEAAVANALAMAPVASQEQSLSLDCPGCPMLVKDKHGRSRVKNGMQNHLELNFSVDRGADGSADRLLLNGFELYPDSDPFHNVLTAPQVLDQNNEVEEEKSEEEKSEEEREIEESTLAEQPDTNDGAVRPQLGFSLQIHPAAEDASDQEYKLVAMDLQIIEVGSRFVNGIPNVHVKLIQDAAGNLMIARADTTASQTLRTAPDGSPLACTTLVCRWLEMFKAKVAQLRGGRHCQNHHHHHHVNGINDGVTAGEVVEEPPHLPGHVKHPGHHWALHPEQVHTYRHSWAQLANNVLSHILLPILIGVLAGVSVSL